MVNASTGKARRQVTYSASATNENPSWSADGRQIVFDSDRGGDDWNLFSVSASGGTARRLTGAPADEFFPDWSPDGRWILFTRSGDDGTVAIASMNRNGSGLATITVAYGVAVLPNWQPLR